jgi:intracellular multiplication protein IcmE
MSDSEKKTSGFGNIMKDKTSRFMIMGVGGVVVVALLIVSFSGSTPPPVNSTLRSPPVLASAVGGQQAISPNMTTLIKQSDENTRVEAVKNGSSALPTPMPATALAPMPSLAPTNIEAPRDPLPVKTTPPVEERPVETPTFGSAIQVNPFAQPASTPNVPPPPVRTVDQSLMRDMQKQLGALMNQPIVAAVTTNYIKETPAQATTAGTPSTSATFGAPSSTSKVANTVSPVVGAGQATQQNMQLASSSQGQYGNNQQRSRFTPPATGSIIYSKLIGRINSDAPGPVVAEILQGPFSGARLLGSFVPSEAGVLIKFSTMTVAYKEDGEEKTDVVPIQAVAVDTEYLGTAMATDIDTHMFARVASAFATSFLQGLGQAVAQSGSTTTNNGLSTQTTNPVYSARNQLYIAGGAASGAVGNIIDQSFANKKPTITVDADTPFGLLFLGNQSTIN